MNEEEELRGKQMRRERNKDGEKVRRKKKGKKEKGARGERVSKW